MLRWSGLLAHWSSLLSGPLAGVDGYSSNGPQATKTTHANPVLEPPVINPAGLEEPVSGHEASLSAEAEQGKSQRPLDSVHMITADWRGLIIYAYDCILLEMVDSLCT